MALCLLITIIFVMFLCRCGCLLSKDAEVNPKDALVFLGESLKVVCVLKTNMKFNITEVSLNIVSTYTNTPQQWLVQRQDHVIYDDAHTVSVTLEAREDYRKPTTVLCMHTTALLDSVYVNVERPIKNISHFRAYYLYRKHVNITWSLGENYMSPEDIGVDIGWSNKSSSQFSPCNEWSNEYCVIEETSTVAIYTFTFIYVKVTVYSKLWKDRPQQQYLTPKFETNATSDHVIVKSQATKSDPPLELRAVGHNSTCLNISWSNPDYLKYSDKSHANDSTNFFYDLTCEPENTAYQTITDGGVYSTTTLPVQICSLRPFTKYSVSVKVKLKEENPWSDWQSITSLTREDRPLRGPIMTTSSFYSTVCSGGTRDVFVYWQKPNDSSIRGVLTGYEVDISPGTNVSYYKLPNVSNNIRIRSLDCELDYTISVFTTTQIGNSRIPSSMFVPRLTNEILNVPVMKIEDFRNPVSTAESRNLSLSWKFSIQEKATVVFYVCQESKEEELSCVNDFNNVEIDADKGFFLLHNVSIKDDLFGYALILANGQTRGIRWTKCVVNRFLKPVSILKITATRGAEEGTLDISWFTEPCNRKKAAPLYFTVFVCEAEHDIEQCQLYNASGSSRNLTVGFLKEDHVYTISIRPATAHLLGDMSDTVTAKLEPRKGDVVSRTKVVSIGVSLFIIILLCAMVIYFTWRCKKSKDSLSNLLQSFPEVNDGVKVGFNYQYSDESGIVPDNFYFSNKDKDDWLDVMQTSDIPSTPQPFPAHNFKNTKSHPAAVSQCQLPPKGYVWVGTPNCSGNSAESVNQHPARHNQSDSQGASSSNPYVCMSQLEIDSHFTVSQCRAMPNYFAKDNATSDGMTVSYFNTNSNKETSLEATKERSVCYFGDEYFAAAIGPLENSSHGSDIGVATAKPSLDLSPHLNLAEDRCNEEYAKNGQCQGGLENGPDLPRGYYNSNSWSCIARLESDLSSRGDEPNTPKRVFFHGAYSQSA